jgi:PAS domain S-box-containing protein
VVAVACWVVHLVAVWEGAASLWRARFADAAVAVLLSLAAGLVLVLAKRGREAQQATERCREALEATADGLLGIDSAGAIAFASRKVSALLGYQPSELLGQPVNTILPGITDGLKEELGAAGDGPAGVREVVGRRKKGSEIALEGRTGPPLPGARGLCSTLVLRDVTKSRQTRELLCSREAFLRLVVEQMPAILWTTDKQLRITSTQGAGLAALKVRPEEVIERSMRDGPRSAHLRAVEGEHVSAELVWNDRAFQVRVGPLRNSTKTIIGTAGILLDVTDQTQAQAELAARERQQAAVAALGQRALADLDVEALMNEAAAAVCETLGVELCKVLELSAEEGALRLRAGWGAHAKAPRTIGLDSQAGYTLRTGEAVIVQDLSEETRFQPSALLRDHGVVSGISVVIRGRQGPLGVLAAHTTRKRAFSTDDLHFLQTVANVIAASAERHQAEEARSRLVAILEATPDFVAIADKDLRLLYLNRAGREMIGATGEENVSKWSLAELYPADLRKSVLAESVSAAVAHGAWTGEGALLSRNGGRVPVSQVMISHSASGGGRGQFFSTVARDVTERQRLEEQLRQSQKMEAIGRLAGGVAHDFNNLLCIINGYGEFLEQQLPSGALHDFAAEIHKAGERATSLTRQLLAFSRKQILAPRPLSLNALIAETDKMLRRLIGEDIQLVTVLGPNLFLVKADPGQMEQVLLNLVVNARDAMPQGGTLTLATSNIERGGPERGCWGEERGLAPPGAYVMLQVTDTGCGMDEETQAHLFEPFFTTKGVGKGTGLGLATVYGIVQQSGGHIAVDSAPGRGTTFRIYLPRLLEERPLAIPCPRPPVARGGTETVLLAEDEEAVLALARLTLREKGYTVLEAHDGAEALAVCQQYPGPIHLLVTDAVMPRLGGAVLAQRVLEARPQTKVLFMSGFTDSAMVRHGVLAGEVECLFKPFSPEVLAQLVREVLDRPEGSAALADTVDLRRPQSC